MQFFTIQNLLHIESIEWIDKETKLKQYAKFLHFADPKTTRTSKYAYKGDVLPLVVGESYKLTLQAWEVDGRHGLSLKDLTPDTK